MDYGSSTIYPIFATVLALLFVVAGLVTLNILPVAQYPDITPPTVQVSAVSVSYTHLKGGIPVLFNSIVRRNFVQPKDDAIAKDVRRTPCLLYTSSHVHQSR